MSRTLQNVLGHFLRAFRSGIDLKSVLLPPLTSVMIQRGHSRMISEDKSIIWIDMEMTGLDPETDHILEVACIITDGSLEVVARGPELIIHQPKKILDSMNSWCKEQHSKTGLIEASLNSKISVLDAENQLLDFVTKYTPPGKCPLGGNSVYMDKMFIMKYFPRVSSHCHYRLIDVSTIKELCRRWYPEVANRSYQRKRLNHRALLDIEDSINELKFYRDSVFKR